MKIYFAGSIRGGREDAALYRDIVSILEQYGTVLTEHIGDPALSVTGEGLPDKQIHDRDLEWLRSCDCVVAEVTTPSLGVGYEIGRAAESGKQVLCLYRSFEIGLLSAMIAGNDSVIVECYRNLDDLDAVFSRHLGR